MGNWRRWVLSMGQSWRQELSTTEVRSLSKAPNPKLLPSRCSVGCPLLQVCVHFFVTLRHQIHTNNYILLPFPKETNNRGSKTSDTVCSFSHKCTEFWLIKRNFRTITWRISCYDFKTILNSWEILKLMLLNVSITHIHPRIHGFS